MHPLQTNFQVASSAPAIVLQQAPNEASLEQALSLSLIGDLDRQLNEIANQMKSQITEREKLRNEIIELQKTGADPALIEAKREELAGMNSHSEITMIQVQSLMDQRKNAVTLLSNLMASKNETLMGIIRNLKN